MSELEIDVARFSEAGIKDVNEDAADHCIPENPYALYSKGVTLAVADGVSTAEAGREASHTAIDRFIEEYYTTPDTWSVAKSGEKIMSTVNLKLYRQSREYQTESKGYLCTFSAIVIKSHVAHIFHVGDSRIYLYRDGKLKQLTQDHVAIIDEGRTCLARAMGMDSQLHVDYAKIELQENDLLLLTSDGVHDFVDDCTLADILQQDQSPEHLIKEIKAKAHEAHTDDNLSAVLARINKLPAENIDDYNAQLTSLPFPPDLSPGMSLDGYRVKKQIFNSVRSQLYLVEDEVSGEDFVLKAPSRNYEEDISYIERFIQEEWIGSRISNNHVAKVIPQERERTALYYVMEYIQGEGLDDWINRNQPPSPKRSIALVKQIAAGLKAFHDNEAIHQDLKPANIMLLPNGLLKIVDFGSVYVAGLAELQRPLEHEGVLGTASYSDPLYLMGKNPGIQGDVYSLATIVYEMFCGHLPYGTKVEECKTLQEFDHLRYRHADEFNPVIPTWFDGALERGVSLDLETRYQTIDDLMHDLTVPNPIFLSDDPVIEKNTSKLVFWKLLSGFWFVTFLLVIYLFMVME